MKNNLNILVPKNTKIAIIGDIHGHVEQFKKIVEFIKPSKEMWFVSVGDILDKGFGKEAENSIIDTVKYFADNGYGFVVRGNHELKNIKRAKANKSMTSQLYWLDAQPLALSFLFENRSRVTIVHGGVKPSHTWDDLNHDIEISYVRKIDEHGEMIKLEWFGDELRPSKAGGVAWHEVYDGRFGYIVAGHEPLKDGKPKFYNYSANIDTACYCTGIMTCQIMSDKGRDFLYSVEGKARKQREG